VQQLHKPQEVNAQPFYYRLLELNSYVAWMPGTEEFLTEDQFHQLFYNGMPGPWRGKFVNSGNVVSDLTIAEHTCYFRQQEKLSLRKQHEQLTIATPWYGKTSYSIGIAQVSMN
jgi:hypothetical protein